MRVRFVISGEVLKIAQAAGKCNLRTFEVHTVCYLL